MEGCVLMCRGCFAQQALSGIPGSTADRLTVYTSAPAQVRDSGRSLKHTVILIKINKITGATSVEAH